MAGMFADASGFDAEIADWHTGEVTDMSSMFAGAVAFNQPLGAWDTSQVTDMSSMFAGADAFDQPIGTWNTGRVADMSSLFAGAVAFNQPLAAWDTSAATSMAEMFDGDYAFDQPIGTWNTGAVSDLSGMFADATSFDEPIGAWDTHSATTMRAMFAGASAFDEPIGGWETARVVDMSSMFADAASFDEPIGAWQTAAVGTMADTFNDAVSFDQPIGTWEVTAVTDMSGMFGGQSGLSLGNYDEVLDGWATQAVRPAVVFDAGATPYNGLAAAARAVLTDPSGDRWTITDGGLTDARIPSIVTTPPVASGLIFGQHLSASQLLGGAASTPGSFAFVAPGQMPAAGTVHATVRFTPVSAYYAPSDITVTVAVARARVPLALTGLTAVRHGHAVIVTVTHLVPGARVTVVWQTAGHLYRRAVTAPASVVRVSLRLPSRGRYRVTASASDPNVVYRSATGEARAT